MSQRSTVANIFIQAILDAAARRGLDRPALLRKAGIDQEVLSNPEMRLSVDQYSNLLRLVINQLDDELFGLSSRSIKPGSFAMMCHATIHCQNLRLALERAGAFYRLLTDSFRFRLTEHGDEARIRAIYEPDEARNSRFSLETVFVVALRWGSWLIDRHIAPDQILFTFDKPDYKKEYEAIFACNMQFGQQYNELIFPRRYLDMPVVQSPATLDHFLALLPGPMLLRYQNDDSTTAQVKRLLDDADCMAAVTLDQLAIQLHTTPQTLRRHLRAEGSSFRSIKESLQRDKAIYLLTRQQYPIQEVAQHLGFSEPSAFHRAFRKWTDETPASCIARYRANSRRTG
ncbi:AraC family transcriptional regulator [Spongorhabdus nitratireducens]